MALPGFNILLLFSISYFLRFTYRFPVLSSIHFDQILIMGMFGCLFFTLKGKRQEHDDILKWFKIILVYIFISIPFVKWPGSIVYYGFEFFLKAIVFFIFTVAFVDTEKKMKVLISVFLACQLFRIIEPAYLHVTQGYWGSRANSMTGGALSSMYRLSSAPADVLNPTQFAGLIVTVIPFFYFLFFKSQKKILKIVFLCLMLVFLYVLFLTGARSGLICLLVVIFSIAVFESGGKIKAKTVLCSIIITIPILFISFQFLSPDFAERYMSIIDSSAKGHDTAAGRMRGLTRGFRQLLTPRSIFGHGIGTSAEANYHLVGEHIRSHSFYIETVQELGIIGMVLFIKYIQSIFKSLSLARRILEEDKKKYGWNLNLIKALQAWAGMFLVYSIICFGLSSWEWYFFGGLSALSLKFAIRFQKEAKESI